MALLSLASAPCEGQITRIEEVRGLAKEESAKALAVRVSGVVVWRGVKAMTGF